MTATKQGKTQPTFWTAIFHDKFTLWYIKLTTYIHKNRFTSHKKYLFGIIFSENPKKSHTNQIYYKFFYSAWREATHKPSKVATAKKFSLLCLSLLQLTSINVFIPCDNWKTLFFIKVYRYRQVSSTVMFLRSLKQMIWKKSVFFFIFEIRVQC